MTTAGLGVCAALVDGALLSGDVEVDGDVVTRVGLPPAAGGRLAVPGYVDLQVNGFAGTDVLDADVAGIGRIAEALTAFGVTAWLPTLVTAGAAPHRTSPAGAGRGDGPSGEGSPDPRRPPRGAVPQPGPGSAPIRRSTVATPDAGLLRRWRALAPVSAVTVAPELPGALDLIASLAAEGLLVSLGHSDATSAQAHAAFDAGARSVTHLFNAMRPLGHRDPGLAGAALARPDVTVHVVVDGHHLADDVVRLVFAAAPGRVVLVTDATAAAGRGDGRFTLAGIPVEVRAGVVRNECRGPGRQRGHAGRRRRNAVALGVDPAAALTAAGETPAAAGRAGRRVPAAGRPRGPGRPRRRPLRAGHVGRRAAGSLRAGSLCPCVWD